MIKKLLFVNLISIAILSVKAPAAASECDNLANKAVSSIVAQGSLVSHECVLLNKDAKAGEQSHLLLLSMNNPAEGPETYLAVVKNSTKKDKADQLDVERSQLIGSQAFPVRFKSQQVLVAVLKKAASGRSLEFATNVMSGHEKVSAVIWSLDLNKKEFKELSEKNFDPQTTPELVQKDERWSFK